MGRVKVSDTFCNSERSDDVRQVKADRKICVQSRATGPQWVCYNG